MATLKPTEVTRDIAVSARELKGLCVTCNHSEICASCKDTSEPVWFCEEFDDQIVPTEISGTEKAQSVFSAAESKPNGAAEGLCGNCAVRAECSFCNPETSIWFCEQYC